MKFFERLKNFFDFSVHAGRVSTSELVIRIFDFCELLTGIEMHPYQEQFSKRVIRSVLENDGEEITALFSRQSGKSEAIANTAGGLMVILPTLAHLPMFADDPRIAPFKDGFWIGIFAPTQRQAQITYGRIKSRIQSKTAQLVLSDPEFSLTFTTSNGQTVSLSNGSFTTAISASEGSKIEGESFKLIICEEAQDISNYKIRKEIHPMGAAYNATIVKIGTATSHKGDFYEAIQRNKAAVDRNNYMRRNHFEYDCDVVVKYNPKYAKYIEKEKRRLGEKSDEFQMAYKLKWIIERGMFIDITQFEANNTEPALDICLYDKTATHVIGIDVGGKGADSTVITVTEVNWDMPAISETHYNPETNEDETYIAYNTYTKAWMEIQGVPDYEEQYFMIIDFLNNYKIARLVIDSTRESAIADRFKANTPYEVIPFVFTPRSKSDLYKHLDREIVAGRTRVCASESAKASGEYCKFLQQMGDLQKGYSGTLMVVAHSGERDAHDDYPDSLALSVYGCASPGDTSVAQTYGSNKFTARTKNEILSNRTRNRITARRR